MKKVILSTSVFVLLSATSLFAGANAGVEQEVHSGEKVQLSGAESTLERNGKFVRFNWKQTEGEPYVSLSHTRTLQTTFTAPTVTESTVLTFRLTTKERFNNRRNRKRTFRSRDYVDVIVLPEEEVLVTEPVDPTDLIMENNTSVVTPNVDFKEIFLDTKIDFQHVFNVHNFFKFTIDERTKIKIIMTDTSSDSRRGLVLRKGISETGEIIGIHPADGSGVVKSIEKTIEVGSYTIETFNDSTVDGTLELLSI